MLVAKSCQMRVVIGLLAILVAILAKAEATFAAGPSFETVAEYPAPFYTTSVKIADMNGDGLNDLVVASQDYVSFPQPPANIAVLLNKGKAVFALADSLSVDKYWLTSICVADFDGDLDNDILAAKYGDFLLIRNHGNGELEAVTRFPDSSGIWYSTVASDFDGDGSIDLAAAVSSDSLIIFLNNGRGNFKRHASYGTGAFPWAMMAADLDADGQVDIVVGNRYSGTVSVFKNKGDATFIAADTDSLGPNINSIFVADLDQDGHPDLAVTADSPGVLWVLTNSGDGTFAVSATYTVTDNGPERQYSLSGGDVNGDGSTDLLIAGDLSNSLQLFVNDGKGTFAASGIYDAPNTGLVVAGDLDGDTRIDFALGWGTVINNGDGTLAASRRWNVEVGYGGLTSGDFDGDGYMDLAVAGQNNGLISLLRNAGNGTFLAPLETHLPIDPEGGIASADFDGDHDLDLIAWGDYGVTPYLMENNGNGAFGTAIPVEGAPNTRSMCAADFDGDGDIDLATGSGSYTLSILKNNGHGTFVVDGRYGVLDELSCILAADFDSDGDLDIATANHWNKSISILMNNGDGSFASRTDIALGAQAVPTSLAAADFDGDGLMDITVADQREIGSVSVFKNGGGGSFVMIRNYVVDGFPTQIIANDFDKDGHPDIAVACNWSWVKVFRNLGDAVFSAPIDVVTGNVPVGLCAADFDGDSYLDIATGCQRGGVSILRNRGGTSFLCGDVDGNGSVGLADIIAFLNYLYLGAPEPEAIAAADVTCDGRIRLNDAVYLIRYLFRSGPEPCAACLE